MIISLVFVFCWCFLGCHGNEGIHHNLPPGVELVDPKSLGFESQLDLDKLLGNVKLLPINSQTDPKTGTKTQVLTVGFEGDENINLDDFELPTNGNSNNTELVNSAFNSFKQYFKNKTIATTEKPATSRPNVVMRRRKVVKTTTTPAPSNASPSNASPSNAAPAAPKVIELESAQIEKLLATGKLRSKKVGDSQVIEITQEQLNQLYSMENGGEFRELLDTSSDVTLPTPTATSTLPPTTTSTSTTTSTTTTTTQSPLPTKPPIIYQFNTKDFESVPRQPTYFTQQQPQQQQNYVARQPTYYTQTVQKQVTTKPSFEFISVPPISYTTSSLNTSPNTKFPSQNNYQVKFRQDPLPSSNQILFPSNNVNARFHRNIGLNTFYEGDGLNYSPRKSQGFLSGI